MLRRFFDYYRQHQLGIKVIRIFDTYGPRMHRNDGWVVSNFIVQALENEDTTVYGWGNQTRNFCFVSDLVEWVMRTMDAPKGLVGPINLGNPNKIMILELAEKVLGLVGGKCKLQFKPLPYDDPRQRQPDINLAKSQLDWAQLVSLDDGLRETIDYFRRTMGVVLR